MSIKRRAVRRGTPGEIALLTRELSALARREVNVNFIKSIFDTLVENRLLQKILSGRISEINMRDLRHPRMKYEDRLEKVDKAEILKKFLPKTDAQLIRDIKTNVPINNDETDLILYKKELKRRVDAKTTSQEVYEDLVDMYNEVRNKLLEKQLIGHIELETPFESSTYEATPEEYKIYPELEEGNVNIILATQEEEDFYEENFQEATDEVKAEFKLRMANFKDESLDELIDDLRQSQRKGEKNIMRELGIKLLGTFIMNKVSQYIPFIDLAQIVQRNKLSAMGITTAAYLGSLFYNYYTSQPGSKIPAPIEERGHVFDKDHNFNGPGTRVESRFELDKRTQGKFPFIFPSGVLDLIALEHDLLYTTPNPEIQQLADLKYVENVRNPKKFLLSLNERTGKELFNSKDINSIVKEFQKNKINYVSAGFIQGQAASRTIDNPLKLRQLVSDISRPGENLIELLKPGEIKRRYGVDVSKLFKKKVPDEYVKYMKDAEKSVNSVLSLMADGGKLNDKGVYVPSKKYNKKTFTEDLQKVHDNFNELVLEQRKVDKEELENIERYRKVKLDPLKVDTFINDFNKIVEDPIIEVEVPVIKENDKILSVKDIQDKMVVANYDSVYSYVDGITAQDRRKEMIDMWKDGQKLVQEQGGKDLKLPKWTAGTRGISKATYKKAYDLLQKQLRARDVADKAIQELDDRADDRQMVKIEAVVKKASPARKKKIINSIQVVETMDAEADKAVKAEEPKAEEPKAEVKPEVKPEVKAPVIDAPFTTEPVRPPKYKPPRYEEPDEPRPVRKSATGNKDNPDNLIDTIRATDAVVDAVLKPSAKDIRKRRANLYDFITPSDQTGGIGTKETNPLVRGDYNRFMNVRRGNLTDIRENHVLSNTNNLKMLQQYDMKEINKRMRSAREAPRKRRGLIRKFPARMPRQRQTREEKRDFQPLINPPSNYAKGSMYSDFFINRPALPLPYEEYVRLFYGNANEFFDGADYYNRQSKTWL